MKPKAKKRKSKETSRPRCICGALAEEWYDPSTRGFKPGSCTRCQEKAVDAELAEGGAIRFTDDQEMKWEYFDVTAEWVAVAEFTGRCRLMEVDGENLWMAIFKCPTADGDFLWLGQPVPWEE